MPLICHCNMFLDLICYREGVTLWCARIICKHIIEERFWGWITKEPQIFANIIIICFALYGNVCQTW